MQRYKLNKDVWQARWLKIKEWWGGLAQREQRALTIGGIVLLFFIIYQGIWSPVINHLAYMRTQIVSSEKTLLWMKNIDAAINSLQKDNHQAQVVSSPVMLLSAFQKQVQQAGLDVAMTELKQVSNNSIEVRFQKVAFDKWIKLMIGFTKDYRVTINSLSINADATSGVVSVELILLGSS